MLFMVKPTRLFAQTLPFQDLATVHSMVKYQSNAEGILSSLCNARLKYSSAVKVTRQAGPIFPVSSVYNLIVRMALPALQVCHDLRKIVVMLLNVGIAKSPDLGNNLILVHCQTLQVIILVVYRFLGKRSQRRCTQAGHGAVAQ